MEHRGDYQMKPGLAIMINASLLAKRSDQQSLVGWREVEVLT